MRTLRVLLIAEAANPEWASVPLEGWCHSRAIAAVTDAHLVTQIRNAEAIARAGLPAESFTAIDSEAVAGRCYRLGQAICGGNGKGWTTQTAISSVAYYYFEHLVWKRLGPRIRRGEFDIVHRLTPLSPAVPSLLAGACRRAGVPFVLGPLNGGVPWPRGFDSTRRQEREWLSYIRSAYRLLPGYRATRRHAAAIIIGSTDTWRQMPVRYRHKCVYIPENGIDPDRFVVPNTRTLNTRNGRSGPLRVIFVGRLVPYKGVDMLLEAARPLLSAELMTLSIVGDGPEKQRIKAMTRKIGTGVTLAGWVDHRQLKEQLARCEVFAFPSIREFGGAVVLEAMGMGVVPIVVNYGGPGELVTDRTGFRVQIGTRSDIITGVREALVRCIRHRDELPRMAEAGRQRVMQQFTWDAKARQCVQVYRWVLGQRSSKPDFGMPLPDMHEYAADQRPLVDQTA